MYRALLKLHIHLKNRVLDLSYAYGFFVADHSLYIILICFGIFLLSLFQITTNVPPPGSTLEIFAESSRSFRPVRARLELNTSDQLHDKQPDKPLWYSGYPLAYVQHIVVRCSILTSRSSCFLRARDIRDRLFSDPQFDINCLRVGEPINVQQMIPYLPSFGCLILSPLNLWSNDISNIKNNEHEILESISSLSKRYVDIIFGIPQKYFSSNKPLTYAITLMLNNASNEYRQDLKKRLFALDESKQQQQQQQQDDIIHIYFSRKSLLYYLPLILIYIVVFLYIYYSVSQFECVKSKWGLALAATVQIVVSLLISLALSSLFHMTPRLDGGEVFPYLVIFIGLENLVVLTRAVTSSQAQKQYDDIRERVAHALRAESWTISKHLVYELIIVMIGFITYVPTVREFCQLALIGILIDFFMQINFWLAVLSIDIRRFTVGVGKKKNRNLEQEKKELKVSLPMKMPYLINKRQQQQQQQSQWARYRVLQRGSMFIVLIWVILIFYKSCLIVDLLHKNVQINREQIKDFVPEKMLNEHYGSSFANQYDSHHNVDDQIMNNISLSNYEWQTLLSYDHWSTLFSFYNISYDNRYLTIMPSIYLPIISSEDQKLDMTTKASYYKTSHRPLIDATITSTTNLLIDRRFSTALWELLFIVLFGLTLFTIVYFWFFSSSFSLNSNHNRILSYIKSDYSIVPTILIPSSSTLLIESICIHESGTVVSVAYSDGSICMWNPQTGDIIFTQQRYSIISNEKVINHVWCSLMIDEYRCLFGCSNGQIEIYPYNSLSKNLILCHNDLGGITHLIRASSILIISTTRRGYLIAFEYINGLIKQIYIKRLHQWPIRVCRIDFNSSLLFTGSDDHSIKIINVLNGSCLHTLQKHQSPINCLALDPYHPTTLVSGCFNGTLCIWKGNDLIQTNINAHPSSIIIDLNFCGHSSNIISLGTDKRLCIWTYLNLQLIYELNDITSNCFTIHRTNYLFYTKLNSLFIYDIFNQRKISTKQFIIPFLNDINRDENEMNIEKLIYSSQTETLILQNSDIIYAMYLPQRVFFVVIGMTNPESHYPLVHWPANSTSNLTGIYNKNQDDCQIFHRPTTSNLLTYLQQKDQAITPHLTDNHLKSSNVAVTGISSSSSCSSYPKQISSSSPIPFQPYLTTPYQIQNTPPYSSSMSNSTNITQISTPRKRKQPMNDTSSFLTPSIPAKRSTPLTMFFPKVTPFDGSVVMFLNNSKITQTDPSFSMFTSSHHHHHHHLDIEQQKLTAEIDELRRTKLDTQREYESTVETVKRCLVMTRSLLIEKSQLEKKEAREKSMENRLRLGQFVTQRQGTSFVEQWVDGYDFLDKQRAQEQLARAKENLDRERKNLTKKKSFLQQQHQLMMATIADETITLNSSSNSQDFINPVFVPPTKSSKRTNKTPTTKTLTSQQKLQPNASSSFIGHQQIQAFSDNSNDGHYLYSSDNNTPIDSGNSSSSSSSLISNSSSSIMTLQDWYEYDEVLRLRQLTLKREECDLAQDLEKLDRERNVHIRELKRLYNEDHSRFNKNNILNERYLLLTLIGKGGFSEVHRAFDLREQRYVACKIHQLNKEWKDEKKVNYIKHAVREYNIHKHLENKRIVKLFDVFEIDTNSFCTVLEYCDGNDLDFFLKQNKTIPEKEARSIIMQTINALKYLNSEIKPPVIHYDLKPGNVLLGRGNNSGEIKITDFGLSKQMHEDKFDADDGMDLTSQGAGTYWYLPPEVFVQGPNPPKISSKVDVWSVGCIFYQCLYGRKPYGHNLSQAAILENQTILNAKEIQFPNRPQVSNEAKSFIRRCLTYQVRDRPDVLQLSEDEYLKSYPKRTTATTSSPLFCPK
ncbi:unnamed protein product [Rotaria sordida]|uniref:Serine/threonine-protein kinase tousled-like 2 n=1 Tax=Rotaria sordida TaxID=392033 RepID=A0A818Y4I6_9BILA|nr:unnamed protein product [Rotaria sordida]